MSKFLDDIVVVFYPWYENNRKKTEFNERKRSSINKKLSFNYYNFVTNVSSCMEEMVQFLKKL